MNDELLLEALAAEQHKIWSHWMTYLFKVCVHHTDGGATIVPALVERWERQIATPYAELSEREKDSDREQARKILAVLARVDEVGR